MKIKTKQFSTPFIVGGLTAVLLLTLSIFISPAPANAAGPSTTTLKAYCSKEAKKTNGACQASITQAVNKASGNCTKSKNPNDCTLKKALSLLKAGNKGSPNSAKYKTQFAAALKKLKKGDPNKFTPPSGSSSSPDKTASLFGKDDGKYQCGGNDTEIVNTRFNFGCLGPDEAPEDLNPILDLMFSIIRFLSAGVGIIIVGSIILAGIQYSSSEGKPDATQAAKSRIQNAVIGLIVYVFAFSIIQYLVPGGLF